MRSNRTILFIGIGISVTAVLCFVVSVRPQPRYKGKTVHELSRLAALSTRERRLFGIADEEANDAIDGLRLLGNQAENALIRQMQTRDTRWRRIYKTIRLRSPPFAKRTLPPFVNASYRRQTAVTAIGKLGTLTTQSEHALALACRDTDPMVRERAIVILGYRGSRCSETLQAINEAMRDPQVAKRVTEGGPSLGGFNFQPKTVEEMKLGLSRPFSEARYQAASALRDLGPAAQAAIPELIASCDDPNDPVRICSVRALGRIGAAASNAVPTLQKMLKDESSIACAAAAEAIRQIETRRE